MKTHLFFPQLTTSASNHSTIHIHNSEYQILELVDWLHSVNTDNWLWISLFCVKLQIQLPFPISSTAMGTKDFPFWSIGLLKLHCCYCTMDPEEFLFFFNFIYLFIYGCVGSSFLREGLLQLRQVGATLHRGARASHYRDLSCRGAQTPDAQAQQLWLTGLVATRHVGSSQTRARTRVPCISRQTLNHCATREAPEEFLNNSLNFLRN